MQMYKYEYTDEYGIIPLKTVSGITLPHKRGRGSRGVVEAEVEFPLSPMMSASRVAPRGYHGLAAKKILPPELRISGATEEVRRIRSPPAPRRAGRIDLSFS